MPIKEKAESITQREDIMDGDPSVPSDEKDGDDGLASSSGRVVVNESDVSCYL